MIHNTDQYCAKCIHCGTEYKTSNHQTTGLIYHLSNSHNICTCQKCDRCLNLQPKIWANFAENRRDKTWVKCVHCEIELEMADYNALLVHLSDVHNI